MPDTETQDPILEIEPDPWDRIQELHDTLDLSRPGDRLLAEALESEAWNVAVAETLSLDPETWV